MAYEPGYWASEVAWSACVSVSEGEEWVPEAVVEDAGVGRYSSVYGVDAVVDYAYWAGDE